MKIKKLNKTYECEVCKNVGDWMGQKLSLHIDHIDGDRLNNVEMNLRYLCPNCHSQTSTYCGRNKAKKYLKFEDYTTLQILEAAKGETGVSPVMRKLQFNVNNNYLRQKVKKLLDENLALRYVPSLEQHKLLKQLKMGNINFSKYGWVNDAAEVLKMEPYSVVRWLKKNFPEFLANCHTRKTNKCRY